MTGRAVIGADVGRVVGIAAIGSEFGGGRGRGETREGGWQGARKRMPLFQDGPTWSATSGLAMSAAGRASTRFRAGEAIRLVVNREAKKGGQETAADRVDLGAGSGAATWLQRVTAGGSGWQRVAASRGGGCTARSLSLQRPGRPRGCLA